MTTPKLAAVIGYPIGHSLSPVIHNTWAVRERANAHYIPVEVGESYDCFARAAGALATLGFSGCNVTLPHKENALRYAIEISDNAKLAGSANMLTFGHNGPYADNTDIIGFKCALETVLDEKATRRRAVIYGAGGAARGVVIALRELGYEKIIVANRTPDRSAALVEKLPGTSTTPWENRNEALEGADILVNTTLLGMTNAPALEVSLDHLPAGAVVADIVYHPLETALLRSAKAGGYQTVDGLAMLMHQAVPGYKAWLGKNAVVDDDLRKRLVGALKARVM